MTRVLVVDDSEDTANTWVQLLSFLGHEATAVFDGKSVHPAVVEFKPQLILLDIGLPDATGFEIAEQITNDPDLAGIRIVAVSGFANPNVKERAIKSGCHEYHLKPVKSEVLRGILANVP